MRPERRRRVPRPRRRPKSTGPCGRRRGSRLEEAAAEVVRRLRETVSALQGQVAKLNADIKGLQASDTEWSAKAAAAKDTYDRVVAAHAEFRAKVGLA